MKKKTASIILAIILIIALSASAFAAGTAYTKQATLHYNGIKIQLNGETITPKDPNGNTVDPFIIDGTTYLPIRAVAEALGLNVSWDSATQTVILYDNEHIPTNDSKNENSKTAIGTELLNQNDIKITYNGITNEPVLSETWPGTMQIKFVVENDTDKNIMIQSLNSAVNGYSIPFMTSTQINTPVVAGTKANIAFYITGTNLTNNGIKNIENVEFNFTVYEMDDFGHLFDSEKITINN